MRPISQARKEIRDVFLSIATLNSIRGEAHWDIVEWDTRFAGMITVGDMKTLEK